MRKGFTLVEVIVVAVIVAILAAVAIPAYQAYIDRSANRTAQNLAATIASEAAAFFAETRIAPTLANVAADDDVPTDPQTGFSVGAIGAATVTVTANRTGSAFTATWSTN